MKLILWTNLFSFTMTLVKGPLRAPNFTWVRLTWMTLQNGGADILYFETKQATFHDRGHSGKNRDSLFTTKIPVKPYLGWGALWRWLLSYRSSAISAGAKICPLLAKAKDQRARCVFLGSKKGVARAATKNSSRVSGAEPNFRSTSPCESSPLIWWFDLMRTRPPFNERGPPGFH